MGAQLYQNIMSIYYYAKGEHPAGYVGYRVSVMVELVQRQKYFATRFSTKKIQLPLAVIQEKLSL